MITPTVGRLLYYYPKGTACHIPHAALVCKVNDDGTLNVCEFDENAVGRPLQNVPLVQEGDLEPPCDGGHFCTWMPYQIEKAKEQGSPKEKKAAHQPHEDHADKPKRARKPKAK